MLVDEPCKNFVKTGECTYGDGCRCARLLERDTSCALPIRRRGPCGAAYVLGSAVHQDALPATMIY